MGTRTGSTSFGEEHATSEMDSEAISRSDVPGGSPNSAVVQQCARQPDLRLENREVKVIPWDPAFDEGTRLISVWVKIWGFPIKLYHYDEFQELFEKWGGFVLELDEKTASHEEFRYARVRVGICDIKHLPEGAWVTFTNPRGYIERYDVEFEVEGVRSDGEKTNKQVPLNNSQGGNGGGGPKQRAGTKPPPGGMPPAGASKTKNLGASTSDTMQTDADTVPIDLLSIEAGARERASESPKSKGITTEGGKKQPSASPKNSLQTDADTVPIDSMSVEAEARKRTSESPKSKGISVSSKNPDKKSASPQPGTIDAILRQVARDGMHNNV